MSRKGPPFERDICKKLSLWWSDGQEDFIFWRTSQSGGRATVRNRVGKRTKGHYGDLCAADPSGNTFTDVFTVEIKKGYTHGHMMNMFDRGQTLGPQECERILNQTISAAERAGTPFWLLIHKRDKRRTILYGPGELLEELKKIGVAPFDPPFMVMDCYGKITSKQEERVYIFGVEFESFLACVDPMDIRNLANDPSEKG